MTIPKLWIIIIAVHGMGIGGDGVIPVRKNIEAERARLGMSKSEMCNALDITLKTYLSYIRGGAIPSTVLVKLRKLTGKTIDYLLDMDNP